MTSNQPREDAKPARISTGHRAHPNQQQPRALPPLQPHHHQAPWLYGNPHDGRGGGGQYHHPYPPPPPQNSRHSLDGYPIYPPYGYGCGPPPPPGHHYAEQQHFPPYPFGYPAAAPPFHISHHQPPPPRQHPTRAATAVRMSLRQSMESSSSRRSNDPTPAAATAVPPSSSSSSSRDYSRRHHNASNRYNNQEPREEQQQERFVELKLENTTPKHHQREQQHEQISAYKSSSTPGSISQSMIASPPPTTLRLPSRKNRDSIGSTLSRESIGGISLAPSQLDSFELDLRSPTSMVISALLHGASVIATVDRPDEAQEDDVDDEEKENTDEAESPKKTTTSAPDKAVKKNKNDSTTNKENATARTNKKKKQEETKSKPPRAKRALLPTSTAETLDIDEVLANPIASIMENPDLKQRIVVQMAVQRDGGPTAGGPTKSKGPAVSQANSNLMQPGFFWRDYPALETVLYDSMAEYYENSSASTANQGLYKQQQAYNNSLVAHIRHVADIAGYHMSYELEESDKHLRDRVRCFYKTHIQNAKKRLATLMKYDNPSIMVQLRALLRSTIQGISIDDALKEEKKPEAHIAQKKNVSKKRGSESSSSSSDNSVVGMVENPTSTSVVLAPAKVTSDSTCDALPSFPVQEQDVEPFFNLENDVVIAATAVSTRNVGHGQQYTAPPSANQNAPYQQKQLPYFPPTKKSRPNPIPSSRIPNPLPSRQAK